MTPKRSGPVHISEALEPVLAEIRAKAAARKFAPRDCTGSPPPRRRDQEGGKS